MVGLLPSMHTALGFNPCANNKKKKVVTTGTISESVHRPLPGWSHELSHTLAVERRVEWDSYMPVSVNKGCQHLPVLGFL